MTATALFAFRHTNDTPASPVDPGSVQTTLSQYIAYLQSIRSGSQGGATSLFALYDQVRATGSVIDNGLTGGDVAGVTISGVDATVTYATSINNTLTLIKNKINAGGNTPNALVTKAVSAKRFFTDASAYFTMSSCPAGTVSPSVDGTACAFTAVDDDAADAIACAAAINAQATAGVKVFAYPDATKCYVVAESTARGTIASISSLTAGARFGAVINGITAAPACGYITASGSTDTEVGYITLAGGTAFPYTAGASDTLTAAAMAAAVNANTATNAFLYATNVAGVVYLFAQGAQGSVSISVVATGTGVTVNTATITGAAGSNAVDSAGLTWAVNNHPQLMNLVRAVNASSTTVVVIARSAGDKMPAIGATGTGLTVGGVTVPLTTLTISTGSGTLAAYIDGNLVASITATGVDATDAVALKNAINANDYARRFVLATSALGVVTVASREAITFAAVGATVTASAAYLTASGTYGGAAGNALTLTSADAGYCIRSAATLSGGVSGVLVTATAPGVTGNAITFAAAGAASGHVTASGTRLGASPADNVVAGAETPLSFSFA